MGRKFARLEIGKWYEQEHKAFQIHPMWFMFCCFEVYEVGEVTWSDWSFRELSLGAVWKWSGRELSEAERPIRKLFP